MDFSNYIDKQENYFKNGNTLPISKRKKLLKNLKKEIDILKEKFDGKKNLGDKPIFIDFYADW